MSLITPATTPIAEPDRRRACHEMRGLASYPTAPPGADAGWPLPDGG